MKTQSIRIVVALGGAVAILAGLASAAGVFLRGDMTTAKYVTVRGERVEAVMDGVYRYNAESIVAEGVGWDLVTLFIVVPAMLIALAFLWRSSLRAALVTAGLLGYFTYQYFEYTMFWAYGPLYPLQLLTAALSVSTVAYLLANLDLAHLREVTLGRFPRRAVTAFAVLVIVVLAGLWLPTILGTLGGEVTDELQGATTLVVPAFDLGLLVPLAVFTAITVHRRLAIGYVLGIVILVKGVSMALAIVAMLLVEWQVTGEPQGPPIAVFGIIAGLSLLVGVVAVRAVDERAASTTSSATDARQTVPSAG